MVCQGAASSDCHQPLFPQWHYKENEMHEGDNPPIGILLCTRKGKKMVEYALAGMDNQLFVSTYMLQLPDKDTLEKFLLDEIERNNSY
jgi:hypothetical protein